MMADTTAPQRPPVNIISLDADLQDFPYDCSVLVQSIPSRVTDL